MVVWFGAWTHLIIPHYYSWASSCRCRKEKKISLTLLVVLIYPTAPECSSRLTGSAKMADCIRVPLLLLLMCILSVHLIRGDSNNGMKHSDNLPNLGGGPGALNHLAEKLQFPGASQSRKRSAGWKLSEEAVCRDDLTRLCPKHSWNNNLAVLECLQDKKEVN